MPNRIIKESICVSGSIDSLNWFEEVLFYRLIVNCDDYGRFDGRVPVIKNRLFPLKENVTAKAVDAGINKLASIGLVRMYVCDGKPYLYLPTWNDHQSVRAKRSKYPAPDDSLKSSENICNHMHSDVPVIQSESESIFEGESPPKSPQGEMPTQKKGKFIPPTLEEVTAFVRENSYCMHPQAFIDYYASKGWMVGKTKMADWKAAVRTWERREKEYRKEKNPALDYPQRQYTEADVARMGILNFDEEDGE